MTISHPQVPLETGPTPGFGAARPRRTLISAFLAATALFTAGLVAPTVGAAAASCTSRDVRTVKTQTYVPGVGYFYDVKMTRCAAKKMSDTWGNAGGSAGAAGTVIGLFNAWTGFGLGALSASQWLTTIKLNSCSKAFTSNVLVTVKGGQIIGCKAYSGSVGGGSF